MTMTEWRGLQPAGLDMVWLHVATMDSGGNFYTGEVTGGKRIQKFVPVP